MPSFYIQLPYSRQLDNTFSWKLTVLKYLVAWFLAWLSFFANKIKEKMGHIFNDRKI